MRAGSKPVGPRPSLGSGVAESRFGEATRPICLISSPSRATSIPGVLSSGVSSHGLRWFGERLPVGGLVECPEGVLPSSFAALVVPVLTDHNAAESIHQQHARGACL